MKKTILALALIGSAALAFAGCNDGNATGGLVAPHEAAAGTYFGIESTEAVYGVAAVTTAKLLAVSMAADGALVALADAADPVTEEAAGFNKYFNMLDSFLDKGETKTVVTQNPSDDPAVKDYAYLLTITGKNAAGGDVTHEVYFSETKGTPTVTTNRDDDETTTIEAVTYTLTGAVGMGEDADGNAVYYRMSGTRTERTVTEEEHGETETERSGIFKMRAYAEENSQTYVELEHTMTSEEEAGETESESLYTYSVYAGGKLTETTQVSFETESEHGETETEYSVRFLSGATRGSYEIEHKLVGGRTVIEVEYFLDGNRGKFTVEKTEEGYRYKFADTFGRDFRDFDD